MKLRTRYNKLNIWNKFFVWVGIIAIIAFIYTLCSDYFASSRLNKIQEGIKNLPNEEQIRRIVDSYARHEKLVNDKLGPLHTVFGISNEGLIVPSGFIPSGVDIDWTTARILSSTPDVVVILWPDITINTAKIKGLRFTNIKLSIWKKVNFTVAPIADPRFEIRVTVLGLHKEVVVIGLGVVLKQ